MRSIERIEEFKKAQIEKPKTRDFYKALSRNLNNEEFQMEIKEGRRKDYEGYSKEVKEKLYNLETRFHFLEIKKKRDGLRWFFFNRREYNRLFKRFKLSDRRIMLKEVNHSVQRQDSEATLVAEEYTPGEDSSIKDEKNEKRFLNDCEIVSSPTQTTSFNKIKKIDQKAEGLEVIGKQSNSTYQIEKLDTLVAKDDQQQVQFITSKGGKTADDTTFSDNNKVVSHDESTKRYDVHGTLADKGIHGVHLTEEQKDVIEFIQNKQLQRDLARNMWYILAYFDMRGTYKKEKIN